MFNTPELFFDLWPILDNLQKFSFLKTKQINENTLLIKNIINPNIDNYIYLSNDSFDYRMIEKESGKRTLIISYYSKERDWMKIRHIPDNCNISLVNSSVIFRNIGNCNFKNVPYYIVKKTTIDDLKDLLCVDENLEHDYIEQINNAVTDKNSEVFTLTNNFTNVCFLIVTDSTIKEFNCEYKCVAAIYTLPQYRNQGYAQYLIQAVLSTYNNSGFLYISDSDKNLASINLARKCGFVTIGYNHQIKIEKSL